jgi:hypothetical protein
VVEKGYKLFKHKFRSIEREKKFPTMLMFCSKFFVLGMLMVLDTIKELMSYPKSRSVEVINNPARPGLNHREVNCINYK